MYASRTLITVVVALVLGCGGTGTRTSRGPDGLLTWTSDTASCQASLDPYPPIGTLQGAPGDRDRVWVAAPDGRRLSIVWPASFTVRFEPDAVLYANGVVVAHAGEPIPVNQEAPPQGATPSDPMPVISVNGICYAPGATTSGAGPDFVTALDA
jgi:hypothetical protein